MKIVFIGDSIVNGFPYNRSCSFPSLYLGESNDEVINKGVNGETTKDVLMRFEKDALCSGVDKVYIMCGTNNLTYFKEENVVDNCLEDLKKMCELSLRANGEPILITPLPVDIDKATKFWPIEPGMEYVKVQEQIQEILEKMLEYGRKNKIAIVDLNKEYRKCMKFGDGIHPTKEGYRFIADYITNLHL